MVGNRARISVANLLTSDFNIVNQCGGELLPVFSFQSLHFYLSDVWEVAGTLDKSVVFNACIFRFAFVTQCFNALFHLLGHNGAEKKSLVRSSSSFGLLWSGESSRIRPRCCKGSPRNDFISASSKYLIALNGWHFLSSNR